MVHLAGRAHITAAMANDEAPYFETNTRATAALADMAAASGVSQFIFASSSKVYAPSAAAAGACETDALAPDDAYGRSKQSAEEQLQALGARTPLAITTLRLPLCYGPGVKARMLSLFRLIGRGLPLPFASISARRSYLGLDNLASAIDALLAAQPPGYRVFNVSDQEDVTLPDLLKRIGAALGVPVRLFPVSPRLIEMAGTVTGKTAEVERLLAPLMLDSTSLSHSVGWHPAASLDEGLARTAQWYRTTRQ